MEVEASAAKMAVETTTETATLSSKMAAIQGLRDQKVPLIVGDFHYLPTELQGTIVRVLKPLIFEGFTAAIIAISHRRFDAIKVERK